VSARPGHLVARFFGSLVPRRVTPVDAAWVGSVLTPPEQGLWAKLGRADAKEGVDVARRADAHLDTALDHRDEYLAAALLHDVGKLDADFGPYRRAIATVAGALVSRGTIDAWKERRGFTRRCALYLDHAELGALRVRVAGGRERVAQWAAAHHDASAWPTPAIAIEVCRLLAEADGERLD
jgi:hypothetical protein